MSTQVVFVLRDSSGYGSGYEDIQGVFSSLELAEKAMNDIVIASVSRDDLYLHIYQVPIDSFERITSGWDQVSSFSGQDSSENNL